MRGGGLNFFSKMSQFQFGNAENPGVGSQFFRNVWIKSSPQTPSKIRSSNSHFWYFLIKKAFFTSAQGDLLLFWPLSMKFILFRYKRRRSCQKLKCMWYLFLVGEVFGNQTKGLEMLISKWLTKDHRSKFVLFQKNVFE